MLPIKFRGRFWLKGLEPSDINTRLNDGDFVFGGYARMKFLFDDDEGDYIIHNDSAAFLVYPDSVAQLVGYDANGNEVYEGDILCAPYGAIKNFQAGVVILQAMCDDFGTKIVLDYDSIKDNKLILKKGNGNE